MRCFKGCCKCSDQELYAYDRYIDAARSRQNQIETAVADGIREVAKNLLKNSTMSFAEIAKNTGLTIIEIERLAEELVDFSITKNKVSSKNLE